MRIVAAGSNVLKHRHLFRRFSQEINSDGGEDDVRQPACQQWRDDAGNGEDPEELEEQDVGEGDCDADAEVQPHATARLTARKRRPDDRQNDDGGRRRKAFVLLNLVR